MSLKEYHRKRNFQKSPEPRGRLNRSKSGHLFVVQKHAASHLHYDFRLELNGVLKSWAVPKGPSLDPKIKALAVEVEDHPLDYGKFEGIIPAGEYGGGTVMVWDTGTWQPIGDPQSDLQQGRLHFRLDGHKLRGEWTLARMGSEGRRANWLLMKRSDADAIPGDGHGLTERESKSALSGRTMNEIANSAERVWTRDGERRTPKAKRAAKSWSLTNGKHRTAKPARRATRNRSSREFDFAALSGATPAQLPRSFSPQLATLVSEVPAGDRWLHEMKFDGYRLLAFRDKGSVRLCTRNGHDWTRKFPSIAAAVAELPLDRFLLDGELVALDSQGISKFQLLQNAIKQRNDAALRYYVFDLPYGGGFKLMQVPLYERKRLLQSVVQSQPRAKNSAIQYSDHLSGDGNKLFQEACRNNLEGIVSKLAESTYECRRSHAWLKTKCHGRQEFVIGGYTKPAGARKGFGALLIGCFDADHELRYAGRVGTGFNERVLRDLKARFDQLTAAEAPFVNPPRGAAARGVTWLEPKLVAEIEFTEWTSDGLLRHPTYQGLREDKEATEVVREGAKTKASSREQRSQSQAPARAKSQASVKKSDQEATIAGVRLTHPDRVLIPNGKITKREIAEYYEAIADWILPYVADRPLTLVRCPDGQTKKCFFQKHWTEGLPPSIGQVEVTTKSGSEQYVAIKNLAGLVSLVQMSVLELHPWPAKSDNLERPDQIVFDLDPDPNLPWADVCQAAQDLRSFFDELKLTSFVRVSGGKGLHVVVPLSRHSTWDDVYGFAHNVAVGLATHDAGRFVANMRKQLREKKIFIDYLRNQRGATSIASYSTRNRDGCPVALPVAWDELSAIDSPHQFDIRNVPQRLAKLKRDPWSDFFGAKQRLTAAMLAAAEDFATSKA